MSKIVIGFLGTGGYNDKNKKRGEYRETVYQIEDKTEKSSFVGEVLYKYFNADKLIYIGTLKSMWDVVYDTFIPEEEKSDKTFDELVKVVDTSNHTTPIEERKKIIEKAFDGSIIYPLIIKYGLNEDEIEYNIATIFQIEEILQNNDELYIDISHGFRSLPIVLTDVLNYIEQHGSKKIAIKKISYGMFEVQGEKGGITPIVDLSVLKKMIRTMQAAYEFKEYGNAYLFAELLSKDVAEVLKDFSNSKNLNDIYSLKQKIQSLKGLKSKYENLSVLQQKIIPQVVEDFLKRFSKAKTDSQYLYEIGKWMFDKKMYGFSAISLTESMITKVIEKENLKRGDKDAYDCAKMLIRNSIKTNNKRRFPSTKKNKICTQQIIRNCSRYKDFGNIRGQLEKIRHRAAHSLDDKLNVAGSIRVIEKAIADLYSIIYN